jgi:hypothetical protein
MKKILVLVAIIAMASCKNVKNESVEGNVDSTSVAVDTVNVDSVTVDSVQVDTVKTNK